MKSVNSNNSNNNKLLTTCWVKLINQVIVTKILRSLLHSHEQSTSNKY